MSNRPMNLPQTQEANLRRQLSYYETLKARAQKKADDKIADYTERQARVQAELDELEAGSNSESV